MIYEGADAAICSVFLRTYRSGINLSFVVAILWDRMCGDSSWVASLLCRLHCASTSTARLFPHVVCMPRRFSLSLFTVKSTPCSGYRVRGCIGVILAKVVAAMQSLDCALSFGCQLAVDCPGCMSLRSCGSWCYSHGVVHTYIRG